MSFHQLLYLFVEGPYVSLSQARLVLCRPCKQRERGRLATRLLQIEDHPTHALWRVFERLGRYVTMLLALPSFCSATRPRTPPSIRTAAVRPTCQSAVPLGVPRQAALRSADHRHLRRATSQISGLRSCRGLSRCMKVTRWCPPVAWTCPVRRETSSTGGEVAYFPCSLL